MQPQHHVRCQGRDPPAGGSRSIGLSDGPGQHATRGGKAAAPENLEGDPGRRERDTGAVITKRFSKRRSQQFHYPVNNLFSSDAISEYSIHSLVTILACVSKYQYCQRWIWVAGDLSGESCFKMHNM
mmetsp:Transcript_10443/g.25241  ORF Transcript_10443/g.25241 Transcript_10443/m.25241 type:complete len:127 (+) Transcript_10443:627-1007(+)